jgi:glycosyltransferase involved in cell wall biosynthesis
MVNPVDEKTQTPVISVIIPVYNAADSLKQCLQAILDSDYSFYECIAVTDGATDGSQAIASKFPIKLLHLPGGPYGPAYARNRGAEVARGSILFFVDSDVVLAPGAVRLVAKVFQEHPDLAAVFGSYDAQPQALGVISQYRNLLHHFVHQNGNPEASTFWAGCGAIRRSVFEAVDGFNERRFLRPSIEDIELGYRLRQSGYRILLDKSLQGTHLKRWTLWSVIRTDIQCRAIPWARLMLETDRTPNDLNIKMAQRVSGMLVMLSCLFFTLGALKLESLAFAGVAFLGVIILNRELYGFFLRRRGLWFAGACIPLHFFYLLYSTLSYLFVWISFRLKAIVSQASSPKHGVGV